LSSEIVEERLFEEVHHDLICNALLEVVVMTSLKVTQGARVVIVFVFQLTFHHVGFSSLDLNGLYFSQSIDFNVACVELCSGAFDELNCLLVRVVSRDVPNKSSRLEPSCESVLEVSIGKVLDETS